MDLVLVTTLENQLENKLVYLLVLPLESLTVALLAFVLEVYLARLLDNYWVFESVILLESVLEMVSDDRLAMNNLHCI